MANELDDHVTSWSSAEWVSAGGRAGCARATACERSHERRGIWGFSVLEVPSGDDYELLVRLRPEVRQQRQLLVAECRHLTSDGFPLVPTLDYPHWTVVPAASTSALFELVRRHLRGPVRNPGRVGRADE